MPEIDHDHYWVCSAGCIDDRIGVNQAFRVAGLNTNSYIAIATREMITAGRGVVREVEVLSDEPVGFPTCIRCGAPALWKSGDERPTRKVPGLTAELLYQHSPAEPFVQFRGAYLPTALLVELLSRGWRRPSWYTSELTYPDDVDISALDTDTLVLPDLVVDGVWTPREECDAEREALIAICDAWGIPLAGPRRRTIEESM